MTNGVSVDRDEGTSVIVDFLEVRNYGFIQNPRGGEDIHIHSNEQGVYGDDGDVIFPSPKNEKLPKPQKGLRVKYFRERRGTQLRVVRWAIIPE